MGGGRMAPVQTSEAQSAAARSNRSHRLRTDENVRSANTAERVSGHRDSRAGFSATTEELSANEMKAWSTQSPDAAREHPPKAPLVFRVGVTGHRPDPAQGRPQPDPARLRVTIRSVLTYIADAFAGVAQANGDLFDLEHGKSTLRLISALAEGPDQWIAEEACAMGYELQC